MGSQEKDSDGEVPAEGLLGGDLRRMSVGGGRGRGSSLSASVPQTAGMALQSFPKLRPWACAFVSLHHQSLGTTAPLGRGRFLRHIPMRDSVIPSSRYSQQLGDRHMDPAKGNWIEPHRIHYSHKRQAREIFIT